MADDERARETDEAAAMEEPADTRRFFATLFDFHFTESVTVLALPFVYALVVAALAATTVAEMISAFGHSFALGLLWLVLGPLLFVGSVTIVRVFLEFVIAIFRITAEVERIGGQVSGIAGKTEELVDDLPKFHFWRRRRPS